MIFDLQGPIEQHLRVIAALKSEGELLAKILSRICNCFESGGRLFIFGNGGSAADSQHIAAELVGRFKTDHRPLPAMALTTDTSILTAVENDFGGRYVFERQVEALVRSGDVVWALSVSGTSANVIAGITKAKLIGATVIGFTGRNGGRMLELCDFCLRVDHTDSDRVQEAHQLAYHLICQMVEKTFPREL